MSARSVLDYIPLTAAAGAVATTRELRDLACARMRALGYEFVATEFAPSHARVRFDVIGISRYTRQVRIYEVKSTRADFLRDDKWQAYLPFCTHFAFVVPAGLVQRWELDASIGIVEYGAPAFERMRRARRYGATILREDTLRATRPSRRLRERVGDDAWIALLETIALGGRFGGVDPADVLFSDGAGI